MSTATGSMRHRKLTAAAVLTLLSAAGNQAYAACTFGGSGEPSLQATFDSLLGAASVDVETRCLADGADALWTTVDQLGAIEITVELAGNANTNTFGIYDAGNNNLIRIFEGGDGVGTFGIVQVTQSSGQWYTRVRDTFDSDGGGTMDSTTWSSWQQLTSNAFGFYLGTASNGTFYSDTGMNADGLDHMYAYGPLTGNLDFEGQYIMAWEDLFNGGDRDYQDFVATVIDIIPIPVPLPPAIWLLASGLLGLGAVGRRSIA